MSTAFRRFVFRAKVGLCLLLLIHVQFFAAGCGTSGTLLPIEQLRIPLASDDPINVALKDSPFAGATGIDLFPVDQSFSFVLPNKAQQLSGKYAYVDGSFTITQFFMRNQSKSATINLDNSKRINSIDASDGNSWKAPPSSRDALPASASLDDYLAANSNLLDVARKIDGEMEGPSASTSATTSGDGSTKNQAGLTDPLRAVLLLFAGIWYPLFGIIPGFLALFTVGSLFQTAMVTRFDGDWTATNSGNKLMVTISNGVITKLVDPSAGQEMSLSNSVLQSVDGNHVVWSVDAAVLGQLTPVTFQFDVQEMANGSLQGTLTTEGSTFAKVPVTMTRAL